MRTTTTNFGRVFATLALVSFALACASSSWEGARKSNTVAGYSRFLRDNPTSEHAKEAEERVAALRVMAHQTIDAHEKFLETYPQSELIPELRVAMEPLYFTRARSENTPESYRAFLAQ